MKRISQAWFVLLFASVIFFGCRKDVENDPVKPITLSGYVYDYSGGVANYDLKVLRNGQFFRNIVTDANGNYSLNFNDNVNELNSFEFISIESDTLFRLTGPVVIDASYLRNDQSAVSFTITRNIEVGHYARLHLHLQNNKPFDNFDRLDSLCSMQFNQTTWTYYPVTLYADNLAGMNVDTTIDILALRPSQDMYRYKVWRNSYYNEYAFQVPIWSTTVDTTYNVLY